MIPADDVTPFPAPIPTARVGAPTAELRVERCANFVGVRPDVGSILMPSDAC